MRFPCAHGDRDKTKPGEPRSSKSTYVTAVGNTEQATPAQLFAHGSPVDQLDSEAGKPVALRRSIRAFVSATDVVAKQKRTIDSATATTATGTAATDGGSHRQFATGGCCRRLGLSHVPGAAAIQGCGNAVDGETKLGETSTTPSSNSARHVLVTKTHAASVTVMCNNDPAAPFTLPQLQARVAASKETRAVHAFSKSRSREDIWQRTLLDTCDMNCHYPLHGHYYSIYALHTNTATPRRYGCE